MCINYEGTSKILLRISRDQKKAYMLKRSFMHAQFKFDKQVQKCPVKLKTTLLLLPIHDVRMRFCAKRLKCMAETGIERKNCNRKRNSELLWEY